MQVSTQLLRPQFECGPCRMWCDSSGWKGCCRTIEGLAFWFKNFTRVHVLGYGPDLTPRLNMIHKRTNKQEHLASLLFTIIWHLFNMPQHRAMMCSGPTRCEEIKILMPVFTCWSLLVLLQKCPGHFLPAIKKIIYITYPYWPQNTCIGRAIIRTGLDLVQMTKFTSPAWEG